MTDRRRQPPDVEGRRVAVVGAARSGVSAAEFLVGRGARVTVSDLRVDIEDAERLRSLGIALELGGHQPHTFATADFVVLSPGVPPEQAFLHEARMAGVPVLGEVEFASRFLRGRVIAITGTKGKSTTTALTGRILAAAGFDVTVGGNIGAPLSGQIERSTPDTLHVVETSSFQLEQIETFHPWIAVMLNVSPDHLDRHPSFEAYVAAKDRIFENQTPDDWAVINADDPTVLALAETHRARVHLFSQRSPLASGTSLENGWVVNRDVTGSQRLLPLSAVHLLGSHLVDDVLAAAAVGSIAGVSPSAMTEAVDGFRGLEHAMELVAASHGVRFVNDSKATNVDAALHAIESFDRDLVPIIGGRFKGGDLGLLREPLATRAKAVVAIGEAADMVMDAVRGVVPVHHATSIGAAVQQAFALARPDGVVLLAPACASFDMFKDYADRGRQFKRAVARAIAEVEDTSR